MIDDGWWMIKESTKIHKVFIDGWLMMEKSTESTEGIHLWMMVERTESTEWKTLIKRF